MTSLDRSVFEWVVAHRWHPLDPVFVAITDAATGGFLWVALAPVVAWRTGRSVRAAVVITGLCVWIADGVSWILKALVDRPRPFEADPHLHVLIGRPSSDSFPSSHATTAFAGAVALAWLRPRAAAVFFALAAVVAFSRVYVGVHYPTDVLAGAVIGVVVALSVIAVVRRLAR